MQKPSKLPQTLRDEMSPRPNWREADLHDLRLRYAALLADITAHRRAILNGGNTCGVDERLWSILTTEKF